MIASITPERGLLTPWRDQLCDPSGLLIRQSDSGAPQPTFGSTGSGLYQLTRK